MGEKRDETRATKQPRADSNSSPFDTPFPWPLGGSTMPNEIRVPTAISGVITRLEGVSFCMDDATHLIHAPLGATRLRGRDHVVSQLLERVADGRTKITVMGYPVWGPECIRLSVYQVNPIEEIQRALGGDLVPWPFKSV
jgi:hypothetical protein